MSFNLDGLSFGGGGGNGGGDQKKKPAPFSLGGAGASASGAGTSSASGSGGFSFGSPSGGNTIGSKAPSASSGGGAFSFGASAPKAGINGIGGLGIGAGSSTSAAGGGGFSFGGSASATAAAAKKPAAPAPAAPAPSAAGIKKAPASSASAFPPMSLAAPKNPFGASSSASAKPSAAGAGAKPAAKPAASAFPPMAKAAPKPFGSPAASTAPAATKTSASSAAAPAGFPPMAKAAPKPFGAGGLGGGLASAASNSAKKPAGGGGGFIFGGSATAAASTAKVSLPGAPVTTPPPPSLPTAKKSAPPASVPVSASASGVSFGSGIGIGKALVPVLGPAQTPTSSTALTTYAASAANANVETKFPPEALGRLACLSPDGRSIHSVTAISSTYTIVTRFLPLVGSTDEAGTAYSYGEAGGTRGSSPTKKRKVDTVRTALPEEVAASLAVDAPIGLICVDNESSSVAAGGNKADRRGISSLGDHDDDAADGQKRSDASLPLLCLYTARSAFVLDISYSAAGTAASDAEVVGTIQSSIEPFEQHLLSAPTSTKIVTILPGPGCGCQSTLSSWDVLCRPGSMMALMSSDGEDSLVLSHGVSGGGSATTTNPQPVTVPLRRGYEDLGSDNSDSIVDVCFVSSSPAASSDGTTTTASTDLFPSMSVLLLSRTGCVHVASPIIFDGALYPRKAVIDASRHLRNEVDRLDNNNPAKPEEAMLWRRAKAAVHFLDEAFGTLTDRSMYVKANALPSARDGPHSSKEWPVATQGPVVVVPEVSDVPTPAAAHGSGSSCIAPFPGTGAGSACVSGFAVGRVVNTEDGANNPRVDIGVISAGTTVLPRFDFESEADADALDEKLEGVGAIVEVIEFESPPGPPQEVDGSRTNSTLRCSLIPDPVDGSALHHVTRRGVVTVTTNAVDAIGQRVASSSANSGREPAPQESISTSAWSLLEVSSPAALEGVGLSGDAHLGHILLATASDGSVEAVNITAAQYLHEASKISAESTSERAPAVVSSAQTESNEALKAMESLPPLHELIAPLFEDISSGLAGMGKIVGGATRPQDANPATVATVLNTKSSCEKDVVLPLKELHRLTTARRKLLQDMYESQMTQIEELRNMVEALRERMATSEERKEQVELSATALSERSAAVLSAARDLVPTITEAEHQYFTQLKRYDASCKKWQGHIDTMKKRADKLSDESSSQSAPPSLDISANDMTHMNELVKGQGNHLKLTARRLEKLGRETKRITEAVGLEDAHGAEATKGKENVHGQ